ncbi:DUF5815 family protein [Halarchaeum nitratireducens]|uniref:Uncharacterized protein n=1 Tax=Halarchaeum nitratireducens TaxID=489913 RepID=A0A830GBI7_9EURY|nr:MULTISPECIES: DUF5815 family protein [Halarchaeum]MBP2250500.1 hypothetical protein [Halarchaeum solikamskense]GGN14847.1 hypothetical protein GCM10009021_13950 [Halarchaeum nitratireducens]
MTDTGPRVPDAGGDGDRGGSGDDAAPDDGTVALPCGETVHRSAFDLGMREYECACGERHAVVMDMHPPSRFVPEAVVDVLRETVSVGEDDAFEAFGTPHLMGSVLEEFPDDVTVVDATDDGRVGYAMLWATAFDARTLHEHVVELVVELMEHAVSHARDDAARGDFEEQMLDFDVAEFVERYRRNRDWRDEYDAPA